MQLQTPVAILPNPYPIDYAHQLMLLGSCFAENIGQKLLSGKFRVDVNPFGILYNPLSVKHALGMLLQKRQFNPSDLVQHQGVYHSFAHHSLFSSPDAAVCLSNINERMQQSSAALVQCDTLIITFGTAYVYFLKTTGEVVGNCHKMPDNLFDRRRISSATVVEEWTELLEQLRKVNPKIRVIFTVSPIRHWKDGAHDNQLSKATLLLAIDELVNRFDCCSYFPAYEVVMDELRDYRFYAEDMIHPSAQTIDYIWQRFCETQLTVESQKLMKEWQKLEKALSHRPFNPQTASHKAFLLQNLEKLEQISKKSPYFACTNEIALLRGQLQVFETT